MDHDRSGGEVRARTDFEYALPRPADASVFFQAIDHADRMRDRVPHVSRRERPRVDIPANSMTKRVRRAHP